MNSEQLSSALIKYLEIFIEEKINIKEYANKNGIVIHNGKNENKGWKGVTIEHILNLKTNNKKGADYSNLEIKTVPVINSSNHYQVKETTCLAVIDMNELMTTNFSSSSLFKKIKQTLFVLIDVENPSYPFIAGTYYLDLEKNISLKEQMNNDYDVIVNHIFDNIENGSSLDHNLTGKLGEVMQPRPKTGKKDTYTWAFYLKKPVLNNILMDESLQIKMKSTICQEIHTKSKFK